MGRAWALFKGAQYVSLYFGVPEMLDRHAAALAQLRHSKGCLRYRRSAPMDWDLIGASSSGSAN